MTINGPAPMLLGFFMNAAIDQQCEKYITQHKLAAKVEAAFKAKYEDKGDQASANQSVDIDGVKTYQVNLMGAAAQATVQGYKYWKTDFSEDFMQKSE